MGRLPIYLISALFVLCLVFLLFRSFIFQDAGTAESENKTVHYISPSGLWSADFLSDPKYSTNVFRDEFGIATVTIEGATLDQGAELYLVRVFHYHNQDQKDLKTFLEEVVTTWSKKMPTLKLVRQNSGRFQNQPSISFSLSGENLEMLGTVFGAQDYFYLIAWVGNMNNKELEKVGENHFETFQNSFQVSTEQ